MFFLLQFCCYILVRDVFITINLSTDVDRECFSKWINVDWVMCYERTCFFLNISLNELENMSRNSHYTSVFAAIKHKNNVHMKGYYDMNVYGLLPYVVILKSKA